MCFSHSAERKLPYFSYPARAIGRFIAESRICGQPEPARPANEKRLERPTRIAPPIGRLTTLGTLAACRGPKLALKCELPVKENNSVRYQVVLILGEHDMMLRGNPRIPLRVGCSRHVCVQHSN
ncbi:unnamed protein product [Caenorhabditis auriculariae]|uniref:Uncharacterized protein n=1 Tax=Caenorhabditis auriculariae TaxID=2777116 RepID=A0A8S1GNR7_9PELO|nr:unnamed protein product [Caenorhabditis auriculariae]